MSIMISQNYMANYRNITQC